MSIIKQKKQRVAIFIDAQNLYHSARGLYGANVNFKNILEDTLSGRELVRAIAYVIATEGGDEKNFFEALQKAGIETKSKDLQIFVGGAKKGDWDVGITVDAIRLASKVDAVIIISGDGDFIPLVEYLKFNAGCQVEAATFASSAAAGLVEVVDDFFDLSQDLNRYLMRSYKNGRYRSFKPRFSSTVKTDVFSETGEKLEHETPEMVAERVAGKRGIPKRAIGNKKHTQKKKEEKVSATEVEISRVKKEYFVTTTKEPKKTTKKAPTKSTKKTPVKKTTKKAPTKSTKKTPVKKTTKKAPRKNPIQKNTTTKSKKGAKK